VTTCAQIARQLPWFVGDDLDAAAAAAVRAHLLACTRCRAQAATLRQAVRRLGAFADAPVPAADEAMFAAMHRRILERVAGEVPAPARSHWLVAAAAAVLLLAVGWWAIGTGRAPTPPSPRLATPAAFEPGPGEEVRRQTLDSAHAVGGDDFVDGPGILWRDRLRQFVDEGMVLPPRQPANR
jgi:anti-sigma factor RsiW